MYTRTQTRKLFVSSAPEASQGGATEWLCRKADHVCRAADDAIKKDTMVISRLDFAKALSMTSVTPPSSPDFWAENMQCALCLKHIRPSFGLKYLIPKVSVSSPCRSRVHPKDDLGTQDNQLHAKDGYRGERILQSSVKLHRSWCNTMWTVVGWIPPYDSLHATLSTIPNTL